MNKDTVKKSVVKKFVKDTIDRYIDVEFELKKKYEDTDARFFIEDALQLRIDLLNSLKKDLCFDSEIIWGE